MVVATVETIYKVGDRVKLRKKPIAASHLKRGDVVTVAAVHPSNGSIKFWNKQSKRWEFAYPDEIGRILNSVTPDEVAVTESTPAPGNDDSVTPVEPAVTESNPPADGEYLALNAVSPYRPRGTARGGEYYRLSYREGGRGRVRHIHIRGGNTDSPIAQAKVQEVRSLLAAGVPAAEIASLIKEKKI